MSPASARSASVLRAFILPATLAVAWALGLSATCGVGAASLTGALKAAESGVSASAPVHQDLAAANNSPADDPSAHDPHDESFYRKYYPDYDPSIHGSFEEYLMALLDAGRVNPPRARFRANVCFNATLQWREGGAVFAPDFVRAHESRTVSVCWDAVLSKLADPTGPDVPVISLAHEGPAVRWNPEHPSPPLVDLLVR